MRLTSTIAQDTLSGRKQKMNKKKTWVSVLLTYPRAQALALPPSKG